MLTIHLCRRRRVISLLSACVWVLMLSACTSQPQSAKAAPNVCSLQWDVKEAPMQTTRPQMVHLKELSWVDQPYKETAQKDMDACKKICDDYKPCASFIYRDHRTFYPRLTTYHCWFYGEAPEVWTYRPETPQTNNGAFVMDTWLVKETVCS